MTIYDKNTNEFYKELNGNCCPEKLLEIARKGIDLYEPLFKYDKIKNHENVIEISLLTPQYFLINNDNQFNKLFDICTKRKNESNDDYYSRMRYIFKLMIINKYIINKILTKEKDDMIIDMILMLGLNTIIKSLYKYNYINVKLFNLFGTIAYLNLNDNPNFKFEISEFFHNNKILLKHILKNSIINDCFLFELTTIGAISLSLLEYISENIDLSIIKHNFKYCVTFRLPFDIIKKYKNKILGSNKLYVRFSDKFSEDFINIMFSDNLIDRIFKKHENWEEYGILNYYKERYNFELDKNFTYEVINVEECNLYNSYEKRIWHYKMLKPFIMLKDSEPLDKLNKYNIKYIYHPDNYSDEFFDIENLYNLSFVKNILQNKDELDKILNDQNYIFDSKFDTDDYTEFFLIQITCLVSLLHNNFNKSVINILLKRFRYTSLENNKITYCNPHKNGYDEEDHLFNALSETPNRIFNGYICIV